MILTVSHFTGLIHQDSIETDRAFLDDKIIRSYSVLPVSFEKKQSPLIDHG
jgi:hypothetical protein